MSNKETNFEFIVIKEYKSNWQKLCFLISGLLTMFSLLPKLTENQLIALPIMVYVVWFICDFLLLRDD